MDRIFERVRLAERKPLGGYARYFRSVVHLGRMCGYIVLRGVPVQNYLLCKQINWYDLYAQAIGCAAAFVLVNGILLAVKILV